MKPPILEIGRYLVPAYAGMVLAEQGFQVEKWLYLQDPIQGLLHGDELWRWVNAGKVLVNHVADEVLNLSVGAFSGVVENLSESWWLAHGVDPDEQARRLDVPWVSFRPQVGERSFDVIAQAQAWAGVAPWVPFYIGDTLGGLWVAYKLVSMLALGKTGRVVIRHADCLAKMVEGELTLPRPSGPVPWDIEVYRLGEQGAEVEYRGNIVKEPLRDDAWRREHLTTVSGRIVV
jgi:hypothetical protein